MGGASGASRLSGIYFILKNANKLYIQIKTYINTYEKDVTIYKDVEQASNNVCTH